MGQQIISLPFANLFGIFRIPRAVDLFSGCGGLTLGLKQAGFRVVGAVEKDPLAISTYKANHKNICLWEVDIRDLPASKVMQRLGLKPGELDLLAGCPPCQGFSSIRTRNGASRNRDPRNNLVDEMLRFVSVMQPKAVMFENVPGIKTREVFHRFCKRLTGLGYKVNWKIQDAADFNVPQRRRRLILMASRVALVSFPEKFTTRKTVRDIIGNLVKAGTSSDPIHDLKENRSEKIIKLIQDIPANGGSRLDLPRNRQLACHKRTNGFKDIYGRMSWDDVAPTITGGCFNPSKGRFLHPIENRAITLREAALLQGFPKAYWFPPSAGKQPIATMIGNALPPELIRHHAVQIKKSL